jgi:N-acetylglutamate synthase
VSLALHLQATWPPAENRSEAGFLLRRGMGAGRRVSSALLTGPQHSVEHARTVMESWGQCPCFQVWTGQEPLDVELAGIGYEIRDPVIVLQAPTRALAAARCDERTVFCEAPLACMEEIWREAGHSQPVLAIMDRVAVPKTWILGRLGDRPEGAAFVARSGGIGILHALEVRSSARRQGLARLMTQAAGCWAAAHGAESLALAVRASNAPALTLYTSLGMAEASRYHYRELP